MVSIRHLRHIFAQILKIDISIGIRDYITRKFVDIIDFQMQGTKFTRCLISKSKNYKMSVIIEDEGLKDETN